MNRSILLLTLILPFCTFAQSETEKAKPDSIAYKVVLDKPEMIRRFYVGIQPIYADAFLNNVNAGFGADAFYLPTSGKFDLRLSFRKPYSTKFFDFTGDKMKRQSGTFNEPVGFVFFEMSGSVSLSNKVRNMNSKIAAVRKNEKNSPPDWIESVLITVPSRIRVIQSARVGFQSWRSAVDVTNVLDKQGSRNADVALPEELIDPDGKVTPFYAFSNLYNQTIFGGYSMTRIKNQSVLMENFETAVQDKIITWYADLMYATSLSLEDAKYGLSDYSLEKVQLAKIGFRAGLELRTNRQTGWGFGAELGSRPAPKKNTSYLILRLSIPVFAGYLVNRD